MKNSGLITLVILLFASMLSCKERTTAPSETETNKEENHLTTYAEISVKEGGEWQGRKYVGGDKFVNVQELELSEHHTDHSFDIRYEGPGWENKQIAYRLYLDWRNAIDIFGKKVDTLVLPYVGQDGFDSYHEPADWGVDILKAGKSMGIGGYGRFMNDTVAHFRNVGRTYAKIENQESSSTVTISYEDWKTGNESINLETQLTIYSQDRFTKAELLPSMEIAGLCTGIVKFKHIPLVKKEGQQWAYIATYGNQTLVSETDKLGMALFYKLDDVANQQEGVNDHLVIFKPSTQKLTYYFLGAWEQEPNGITNETDFYKDLNEKLELLESKNTL